MALFACQICQNSRLPWRSLCADCQLLFKTVKKNLGQMGFSELIDSLIDTGIQKDKVQQFLKADPHGKGSILDQVTAQLTNDLAKGMGVSQGALQTEDVKRIRENPTGFASQKPLDH